MFCLEVACAFMMCLSFCNRSNAIRLKVLTYLATVLSFQKLAPHTIYVDKSLRGGDF